MRQELQQSVTNAVTSQPGAVGVSGLTFGAGISTALNVLPIVVGSIASFLGIILSIMLIRKAYYSTKLEQKQLEMFEKEMEVDG